MEIKGGKSVIPRWAPGKDSRKSGDKPLLVDSEAVHSQLTLPCTMLTIMQMVGEMEYTKRSQVTTASIIFFCFVGEVRLQDGDNTGGGWKGRRGGGISAERPALDAARWKLRGNLAGFFFCFSFLNVTR